MRDSERKKKEKKTGGSLFLRQLGGGGKKKGKEPGRMCNRTVVQTTRGRGKKEGRRRQLLTAIANEEKKGDAKQKHYQSAGRREGEKMRPHLLTIYQKIHKKRGGRGEGD